MNVFITVMGKTEVETGFWVFWLFSGKRGILSSDLAGLGCVMSV